VQEAGIAGVERDELKKRETGIGKRET